MIVKVTTRAMLVIIRSCYVEIILGEGAMMLLKPQ